MSEELQPIIIKRRKQSHAGHHSGAWKVAFADFMTALMCFFLVMWLIGQKEEVREAVAGYFRDPGKFMHEGRSGVLKGTPHVVKADDPTIGLVNSTLKNDAITTSVEREKLTLTARNIIKQLQEQPAFQALKKNITIQMTSEGLRITLNESKDGAAFFEPGSAKLLRRSAVILMVIAKELGKINNHLVVEGHTDANYTGDHVYT